MAPTVSRKALVRGTLPLLLAAFLAVLAFALEFHHHDDGDSHPDCSFCVALHHAQSASLQHQETGPAGVFRAHLPLPSEQTLPRSLHLELPVIRPPPGPIPA